MKLVQVYRITVFVPVEHLESLKAAICAIDTLDIGGYEHVLWSSLDVKEQFRPCAGANPTVGTIGSSSVVESARLEFCIPRDQQRLHRLIEQGIFPHHPWEVPAIFVEEAMFPLK